MDNQPSTKTDIKTKTDAKKDTKKDTKKDPKKDTKSAKKTDKKDPGDKTADRETKKPPTDKKVAKVTHAQQPNASAPHGHQTSTPPERSLELSVRQTSATARLEAPVAAVAHAQPVTSGIPLAEATTAATPPADVDAVRQAIGLARAGKTEAATAVERAITDPLARKLVEWVILRSDDNDIDFARYNAFIAANPGWPGLIMLRRRAEAMLWQERAPSATVRAHFA